MYKRPVLLLDALQHLQLSTLDVNLEQVDAPATNKARSCCARFGHVSSNVADSVHVAVILSALDRELVACGDLTIGQELPAF